MIQIAICDDEKNVLNFMSDKIKHILKNKNYIFNINSYIDGQALINDHKSKRFDIIFIDIEMPQMDGLSVAKNIREFDEMVKLVIVTNRDDLVYDVFEYDISAFCRKKENYSDLEKHLLRLCKKVSEHSMIVKLKSVRNYINIDLKDVLYFEVLNHDLFAVTVDKKIKILYTLSEIENIVKEYKFVKCYSSYIVNIDHINCLDKKDLKMSNNEQIPISRTYYGHVKECFYENMRTYK